MRSLDRSQPVPDPHREHSAILIDRPLLHRLAIIVPHRLRLLELRNGLRRLIHRKIIGRFDLTRGLAAGRRSVEMLAFSGILGDGCSMLGSM